MNQLAGVLSDLGLVRWPNKGTWFKKSELEELKDDEVHASATDITEIRKKWVEEHKADASVSGGLQHRRPSAITACSPRPCARWRSPAGA